LRQLPPLRYGSFAKPRNIEQNRLTAVACLIDFPTPLFLLFLSASYLRPYMYSPLFFFHMPVGKINIYWTYE
jgi:hypothetical protein